jgi:hypothetical protein
MFKLFARLHSEVDVTTQAADQAVLRQLLLAGDAELAMMHTMPQEWAS